MANSKKLKFSLIQIDTQAIPPSHEMVGFDKFSQVIYFSEKIQISNTAKNTRMAFKDQINQNVGFFIYNREFSFSSGIIGSRLALT